MAWGGAYDHLPGFPDWNPGTCLKGSWGPARAAVEQSCFALNRSQSWMASSCQQSSPGVPASGI